jgi:PadR family transcriptional regulator PadR
MKTDAAMSPKTPSKTDVLQGTLDLMVLNMGTLYPALMRLEQRGLLKGSWGTTDTNRKARFYALTAAGRRQLAKEQEAWDQMAGIIHTLLHSKA